MQDESAETAIRDADHTPTKIKKTKAGEIHTTASSDGARFVAGHVLAGRYRIISLVGKGGMGEVYKAEDLELEQTVAIKFLPKELSKEEVLLKRFRSEVRTARQVSHPNVCRVFDIGETEGLYYITMEFIEGDDLSMLLNRIGRLPSDKAVEISRQISFGLGAIHKSGILHRDLKPSNIIIDSEGEARITDFGIAGIEAEVQGEEARVGTPAYMSPEQITGREVTQKSDIYSLGLLLYEIFTGKQAFEGSSVQELKEKHTKEDPTNPSQIVTGIDPVVEDLIEKCLKKDPKERPDSALKVAMMLPGGNPLQVALEAGETPTPEMVAAAPKKGALSRAAGLSLFFAYLTLLSVWVYWYATDISVVFEPVRKPPEVLADRARVIAAELGYPDPPADSSYGYFLNEDIQEYADNSPEADEFWNRFRTGRPSLIRFDYRESPQLLIPINWGRPISESDPPMTVPGMIRMELDVAGRLLKFAAVPPEKPSPIEFSDDVARNSVFVLAGLEPGQLEEIQPLSSPIYNHDESRAWRGNLPDNPDIPVIVQAASLNGRIISFEILGPWENAEGTAAMEGAGIALDYLGLFFIFLTFVGIFGAGVLARYHLKNGRGDLRGAVKVGLTVFVFRLVAGYIDTEKIGAVRPDVDRFLELFESTPMWALIVFLVYLAIEPIARRRFPEMLVSWNRLLSGSFRDPLVGRDVLLGMLIAVAATVSTRALVHLLWGFETGAGIVSNLLDSDDLKILYGTSMVIGQLLTAVWDALIGCFMFLFFYLGAFLIFRNKWVAALAFVLFFSFPIILSELHRGYAWAIIGSLSFIPILVFCYLRFGVVTAAAYLLTVPHYAALTLDPEKFHFPSTLVFISFYLVIAFVAFLISTARQPFFKRDLLQ